MWTLYCTVHSVHTDSWGQSPIKELFPSLNLWMVMIVQLYESTLWVGVQTRNAPLRPIMNLYCCFVTRPPSKFPQYNLNQSVWNQLLHPPFTINIWQNLKEIEPNKCWWCLLVCLHWPTYQIILRASWFSRLGPRGFWRNMKSSKLEKYISSTCLVLEM